MSIPAEQYLVWALTPFAIATLVGLCWVHDRRSPRLAAALGVSLILLLVATVAIGEAVAAGI
jgi:hypothetical protein